MSRKSVCIKVCMALLGFYTHGMASLGFKEEFSLEPMAT